ncbi:hypothetical protein QTL86_02355 [Cellulosilyticum sp. ST5]|uniref:hypothetical protein n=1 Tax=unclassified Cellulosilyticum TaxID=2643091 RepID=UPI000F8F72D9|nr:hypothetical protein [Cellulosilyticum sp. WCF-2]QEH70089.1 hypothetical protein EKH84_17490 [Cellulosilyticum sp. WCF-2]
MTFDCRKSAFLLLSLYAIIPVLYMIEAFPNINLTYLAAMLLGIVLLVNISCNNYKVTINDEALIVYRVIGKEVHIDLKQVHKIQLLAIGKNMKLIVITGNKQYTFAINGLDEKRIALYLNTLGNQSAIKIEVDLQYGKNKQAYDINNFS